MARYSKTKKNGKRFSRKYDKNNKMTGGGDKKGTKSKSPSLRNRAAANPLQRNDMSAEGNHQNIFDILRGEPRPIQNSRIIINEIANKLERGNVNLSPTKRSPGKLKAFIDNRLIKHK